MARYTKLLTSLAMNANNRRIINDVSTGGGITALTWDAAAYRYVATNAAGTTVQGTSAQVFGEQLILSGSSGGGLKLYEGTSNGVHSLTVKAPDAVTADKTLTLPDGPPATSGYALVSTDVGVMSWAEFSGANFYADALTYVAGTTQQLTIGMQGTSDIVMTGDLRDFGQSIKLSGTNAGSIDLHEAGGSELVRIQAPATVTGIGQIYTLPDAYPAGNGYALVSSTAGAMSWAPNSSANYYVTGGTYNAGNDEIDFTGVTGFPAFSVDTSAFAKGSLAGAANYVGYFTATNALTGTAGFQYDGTNISSVDADFTMSSATTLKPELTLTSTSGVNATNQGGYISFYRNDSTNPYTSTADVLGTIQFQNRNLASVKQSWADIKVIADDVTANNEISSIRFRTRKPATTTLQDTMTIYRDRVGIKTNTPAYQLDVVGTTQLSGNSSIVGTLTTTGVATLGNNSVTNTQTAGNNTTRIATTAFVAAAVAANSGTPAGSSTQLQYNNGGAFGGVDDWTWNGTDMTIATGSKLIFGDANRYIDEDGAHLRIRNSETGGNIDLNAKNSFRFYIDGAQKMSISSAGTLTVSGNTTLQNPLIIETGSATKFNFKPDDQAEELLITGTKKTTAATEYAYYPRIVLDSDEDADALSQPGYPSVFFTKFGPTSTANPAGDPVGWRIAASGSAGIASAPQSLVWDYSSDQSTYSNKLILSEAGVLTATTFSGELDGTISSTTTATTQSSSDNSTKVATTAYADAAASGGGISSPLTTKGDIWVYTSTNARLGVGTNTHVLTADSSATSGLAWAAPTTGTIAGSITNDQVAFGASTANSIEGNANLTFDGDHLKLLDDKKLILGTGDDIQIYHNGTNSYVTSQTGDMNFLNYANDADMKFKIKDNTVETEVMRIVGATSNVAIGTPTPLNSGKVTILDGSNPQLVLANDGTEYFTFEADGNYLNITAKSTDKAIVSFRDNGNTYFNGDNIIFEQVAEKYFQFKGTNRLDFGSEPAWQINDQSDTLTFTRNDGTGDINVTAGDLILNGDSTAFSIKDADGTETVRLATASGDQGLLYLRGPTGGNAIYLDGNGSSFLNGGNVGIGTTEPPNALSVWKAINNDFVAELKNTHATAGQSWGLQVCAGTNASDAALAVENEAENASLFYVRGDGNVGIGTVTPTMKLDVLSTDGFAGYFRGTSTATIASDTTNNNYLRVKNASIVDATTALLGFQTGNGYLGGFIGTEQYDADDGNNVYANLVLGTKAVADSTPNRSMTILHDGKVGIGTATPDYTLELENTAPQLGFNDTNGRKFYLMSQSDKFWLGDATGGTTPLVVDSAGDVGIGTTSPSRKLHVVEGSNGYAARFEDGIELDGTNVQLLGYGQGNLWLMGNSGNPKLTLGYSHNWDFQISLQYLRGATAGSSYVGDGELKIGQLDKNNANWDHGITSFYVSGSEAMRLNKDRYLGIGTTAPSFPLSVSGTQYDMAKIASSHTAGSCLYLDADGTGGSNWHLQSTADGAGSGGGKLDFVEAGTSRMIIAGGGNVGIGTTGPNQKLDVAGNINIQDGYNLRWNNATQINILGSSTTGLTYTASKQHFLTYNGVSAYTELMTLDDTGVGIGTTSPAFKLDVVGTTQLSGNSSVVGTFSTTDVATLGNNSVTNTQSAGNSTTRLATTEFVTTAVAAGGNGDVSKAGTPVDNQLAVWTGTNTIEGNANLTFNGTTMYVSEQLKLPGDNYKLMMGASDDLQLYHEGTDSYITSAAGDIYLKNLANNEDIFLNVNDGGTDTIGLHVRGQTGRVGIGNFVGPNAKLEVRDVAAQLRLAYNGTYFMNTEVSSAGSTIWTNQGHFRFTGEQTDGVFQIDQNKISLVRDTDSAASAMLQLGDHTTYDQFSIVEDARGSSATNGHVMLRAKKTGNYGYARVSLSAVSGASNYSNLIIDSISTNEALRFDTNTKNHAFDIAKAGYVSIGAAVSTTDALYVNGNTTINGVLSATAKSFNIPHPLYKDKRLVHGSLEGPEHAIYVRGTIETEEKGCLIELPEYWSAMCEDYTVQLTPHGPYTVFIKEKLKDKVMIECSQKKFKFDYYIVGARTDETLEVVQDA